MEERKKKNSESEAIGTGRDGLARELFAGSRFISGGAASVLTARCLKFFMTGMLLFV